MTRVNTLEADFEILRADLHQHKESNGVEEKKDEALMNKMLGMQDQSTINSQLDQVEQKMRERSKEMQDAMDELQHKMDSQTRGKKDMVGKMGDNMIEVLTFVQKTQKSLSTFQQ